MNATFAILMMILTSFQEQSEPGIYIINPNTKRLNCDNEMKMIVGKVKICLSKKPIVRKDALSYATDIRYDPVYKEHYIELGLSSEAGQILFKTVGSLPESKFALALEGDVICIFSLPNPTPPRSIKIGNDVGLRDLTLIHNALNKVEF
ncbi:MAG: hypothetical protein WKF87_12540 [Chryseolinea sp.]